MKIKTLITCLAVTLIINLCFAENTETSRIYGGYYSPERINNLRNNCARYQWAGKQKEMAITKAKKWLAKSDEELWSMVPGQDLPRTIDVTFDRLTTGPKSLGCLVCGEKISKYGNYPYNPDIENKPWKLTCPSCGAVFPTNDFGKYYKSAIDEKGLFNPAKGDKSLLFNTAHPDPNDPLHKYGVDDGYGYIDQNGRGHRYIGYYTWKYWSYLNNGLKGLADGYLFTGDKRYAHKAAILLDRIADVYPDMDWKPYADRGWYHSDGGSMMGKIEGCEWETDVTQDFADSYDKILSGTKDDPDLYVFLKKQSEKYKLPNDKGTREQFVGNVDNGILKTTFDGVLSRQIRGNQGMHQLSVAMCALALNSDSLTTKWLDWLFAPDGGAIPGLMISRLDRDGTSDEGAPGYATMWGELITKLAERLAGYPNYTKHNIFKDFPQFRATFLVNYRMTALGLTIPNLGDAGSTGLLSKPAKPEFIAKGYYYTHDPELAMAAYRTNGNSAKGLGLDIFSKDPEAVGREIQSIGEKAGPRPVGGYLMSGYGLAMLESGTSTSGIALVENYGRTKMHGHPDLLNFDLFAFGLWLAPDHGYPEFATLMPSRTEWTGSTISHNVVYVNKKPQTRVWGGHTVLYKQIKGFGAFESNGQPAYPDLKVYNRTMLLIGGDKDEKINSNAYVVDIFRVVGGNDHVYGFHGPPGMITTSGLTLEPQKTGTYAGEQIPKGIWSKDFPIGYAHLYNVQRDQNPPAQFMLDWKAEAGYRGVTEKDDIHLRMHALSPAQDVALADGDPPQNKAGNPLKLGYLLMHRAAPNLSSTFVSVFEPYKQNPFIKSVKRLDDGKGTDVTIQVELADGTFDYVLYNSDSRKVVSLANGISMNGTLGYVKEKKNKAVKGILINGTDLQCGKMNLKSEGAITGKVVKINKELTGGGWMLVDTKLPVDGSLVGEQIIIDTDQARDATYTIRNVERQGDLTKIYCGPITFVRDFAGGTMEVRTFTVPKYYDKGYLYDFEEGAGFRITSHKVWKR